VNRPRLLPLTRRLLPLLLATTAALVQAQGIVGSSSTQWSSLTPAQRGVLAPLAPDWRQITPAQQQKWLEVANRYSAMPPEERERVQQRMGEWSRLSAPERARARLNFQEARQLSPAERQQQWEAYRALPADQRRALAERARETKGGPTVVQRGSGATTNLVSKPTRPPLHQQVGLPKVAATPGFVDAETLLPQRGAQGAASRAPARNGKGDKER
jgi:hypothetical protein